VDSEGIPFGAKRAQAPNNSTTVEDTACFDDGFAIVKAPMVETH